MATTDVQMTDSNPLQVDQQQQQGEEETKEDKEWIVKELKKNPPPPPLPTGWVIRHCRSQPGYIYYYHQETGVSQWEKPQQQQRQQPQQQPDQQTKKKQQQILPDASLSKASTPKTSIEEPPHKKARTSSSKSTPKEVRVLHILKKHNQSRRPTSWRKSKITISKQDAIAELQGLMSVLKESSSKEELRATFEELARTESDCSSAKRGGDLGFFGRKKMQPPFEHASFALDIGQMSDVVESSSGVHVILRIG